MENAGGKRERMKYAGKKDRKGKMMEEKEMQREIEIVFSRAEKFPLSCPFYNRNAL